MRALQHFGRNPDVETFVRSIIEYKIVHTVLVDVHPIWSADWDLKTTHNVPSGALRKAMVEFGAECAVWPTDTGGVGFPGYDFSWASEDWDRFCRVCRKTSSNPFVLRVLVHPPTRTTVGERRQLEADALAQNFFVSIEDRDQPQLASATGLRHEVPLGSSVNGGTLGGVLRNHNSPTNDVYATTCAHVSPYENDVFDLKDASGTTRKAAVMCLKTSPLTRSNSLCNPYGPNPNIHDVDVALLRVSGGCFCQNDIVGIGPITAMAFKDALEPRQRVKLEPRQRVKMRGQKSGLLDLRVGAYALTMKIKDDAASEPGQRPVEYCFTDLYELRGTPNAVLAQLSRGVGQLLANIPQQGDSGAWVCCPAPDRPTPGDYAFCGMVVATDFVSGYATFVDGIRGWAAQYPEYDLRLP